MNISGSNTSELGDRLLRIYVDGQTHNETAQYIVTRLRLGDEESAYNEFARDGDKIPRWSRWGREFAALLHNELGCRLHRVKACDAHFCKTFKE